VFTFAVFYAAITSDILCTVTVHNLRFGLWHFIESEYNETGAHKYKYIIL